MADGRIVIDTRVNNAGAQKDLKALQRDAAATAREISAIDKRAAALKGDTRLKENLDAARSAAAKTTAEIERLGGILEKRRLDQLALVRREMPGAAPAQQNHTALSRTLAQNPDLVRQQDRLTALLEKQEAAVTKAEAALGRQQQQVAGLESRHAVLTARLQQQSRAIRQTAAAGEAAGLAQERAFDSLQQKARLAQRALTALAGKGVAVFGRLVRAVDPFSKALTSCSRGAHRFGRRLWEIAGGALFFNGISAALRSLSVYFKNALLASEDFRGALARLKGAAATAAAPLVQALTPALTALANAAATALAYLARLVSFFTGKSLDNMQATAKSLNKVAASGTKAGKSLAAFDEISRLDTESPGGAGGGDTDSVAPDFSFDFASPFWESLTAAIQDGDWRGAGQLLADKINSLADGVDWEAFGQRIGGGLDNAIGFLATAIRGVNWKQLGADLGKALNGMLDKVNWYDLGTVLGAKCRILVEGLGGLFATLDWEGLGRAFGGCMQGIWDSVDWLQAARTLSAGVKGLLDALGAMLATLDWEKIGQDIAIFIANIDWLGVLESLVKFLWNLLKGLLDFIGGLLLGLVASIWNPIAEFFGWETIRLDGLMGEMHGVADRGYKDLQTLTDDGLGQTQKIVGDRTQAMREAVDDSADGARDDLSGALQGMRQDTDTGFRSIGAVTSGGMAAVAQTVDARSGDIGASFGGMMDGMQRTTSDTSDVVSITAKKMMDGIKGTISERARGIKDSLSDAFKRAVNGAIEHINRFINWVNGALDFSWDGLTIMGKQIIPAGHIQLAQLPAIPYLAQGAVIPANREFLAVLGDQKSGTNVEAPLETIKQALREALADSGGDTVIRFEGDLAGLARLLRPHIEREGSRRGGNLARGMVTV